MPSVVIEEDYDEKAEMGRTCEEYALEEEKRALCNIKKNGR